MARPTKLNELQFSLGTELIKASLCNSKKIMRACIGNKVLKKSSEWLETVRIVLTISVELNHMRAAKVLAKYLDGKLWRVNLLIGCILRKKWLQAKHLLSDDRMKKKIKKDIQKYEFFDMLKTATMTEPSYEWDQKRTIEELISLGNEFNYSAYTYSRSYELDDAEEEEEVEDALIFTVKAGSLEMVECLLNAGVKPRDEHFDAVDELKTRAETIETLMERGISNKRKRDDLEDRAINKVIRYQRSNCESDYN
ncbi:hypothetical protein COCC4DRAFT_143881 [Bipolaris maydis ATCC 48331]|uniref:Ankyrin repeat protein n=2 Tax=Cochliobolus heterostrophus TaxID=5016 RepID=M2SNF0_COCH5|nr:uncharacterized protein COCC4DRAFT_143881 [Bipolaris maydis ATCC 48331]EMD86830.1 hypothetical protein COCHEDRAFT_1115223 [Bipolaris maydis C5]KAJ5047762.1 hypothetical protein J3E74DRAFT_295975 [Bipolaris maydis]ENI03215.1 hypothetical protein COCC4DRAFT_143881 [Bipolaris maydis ATCC 48331]KAJ6203523.1 hypothetical protein PSV09DRAFT_1115223 [Bipolaris maydis]KAJ6265108.1 hypothetical protein PSV08DRAFT_375512 [Bipolaris maydis]